MHRRSPRAAPAITALALLGCDPDLRSDQGRLGIDVADLTWPQALLPYADVPVVVGSRWCPTIAGVYASAEHMEMHDVDVHECFALAVDGPVAWNGACAELQGAGSLSFTATPLPCASDVASAPTDPQTLAIEIVDPSAVAGRLHTNFDAIFEQHPDFVVTPIPDGWRPAAGETLLVAEGGFVYVTPGLVTADGRGVAFSDGELLGLPEGSFGFAVHGTPGLVLSPSLRLPSRTLPLGDVRGVAADDAASLDIVAIEGFAVGHSGPDGETREIEWTLLRADVRDGDARPLFGTPIDWSIIDGRASLRPAEIPVLGEMPSDHAAVADICRGRATDATTVIVQARLGTLRAEVELDLAPIDGATDEDWPGEDWLATCEGPELARGCACGSSGPPASPLALALLAWGRRRRR